MCKSNIENRKLLVFSNFVEIAKKVFNLVTLLFDFLSLLRFLRDFIFWNEGTTEKAIENIAKMKSFAYLYWRLCNSTKVTWGLSSLPPTHLEQFCEFFTYIL